MTVAFGAVVAALDFVGASVSRLLAPVGGVMAVGPGASTSRRASPPALGAALFVVLGITAPRVWHDLLGR